MRLKKVLSAIMGSLLLTLGVVTVTNKDSTKDVNAADASFVKITNEVDLTNGAKYLIVYEDESFIFDGSLTTLDAANNYQEVTISGTKIVTDEKYAFTCEKSASGSYTLKSSSGYYIGNNADSNKLSSSTEKAYTNIISFDKENNLDIKSSGGSHLRFNTASGQDRFRYYKSGSYASQKAICLYKIDDTGTSGPSTSDTPSVDPSTSDNPSTPVDPVVESIKTIRPTAQLGFSAAYENGTKKFEKVADLSKLSDGDEVYIAYPDGNNAAGFKTSSNYLEAVTGKFNGDIIDVVDDAAPFTLKEINGNWQFMVKDGETTNYLYWESSLGKGKVGYTTTSTDENNQWTLGNDTNGDVIIKNVKNPSYELQYNSGSPRFACYAGTQKSVQLYKSFMVDDGGYTFNSTAFGNYSLTFGSEIALEKVEGLIDANAGETWTSLTYGVLVVPSSKLDKSFEEKYAEYKATETEPTVSKFAVTVSARYETYTSTNLPDYEESTNTINVGAKLKGIPNDQVTTSLSAVIVISKGDKVYFTEQKDVSVQQVAAQYVEQIDNGTLTLDEIPTAAIRALNTKLSKLS